LLKACKYVSKNDASGGIEDYTLVYVNMKSTQSVPESTQSCEDCVVKAVLHLRIAATSMSDYVSGWCGHGIESYSQLFLLTYPEADLSL